MLKVHPRSLLHAFIILLFLNRKIILSHGVTWTSCQTKKMVCPLYAVIVLFNQILAESVGSFFFFFPKEQIRQTEQTINLLLSKKYNLSVGRHCYIILTVWTHHCKRYLCVWDCQRNSFLSHYCSPHGILKKIIRYLLHRSW